MFNYFLKTLIILAMSIMFLGTPFINPLTAAEAPYKQKSLKVIKSKVKIEKYYVFKTGSKSIKISKNNLYKAISTYIYKSVGNDPKFNNKKYVGKVANGFINLIDEVDDSSHMLRYIALCNVESNFRTQSTSGAGAKGIPQVMLSVWQPVMTKHWGISKSMYLTSIQKQLYVGYKIYDIQLKKYKGNVFKAHNAYSGGHSSYHKKVMVKYRDLIKTIES